MSKKRKGLMPQSPLKSHRQPLNNEERGSILERKKEIPLPNNLKDANSITPLPSPSICKHHHLNLSKPSHIQRGGDSSVGNKSRLHSNSSGEFMDYFGAKLRSISPLRRPNTLLKSTDSSSALPSPFLTVTNQSERKLTHCQTNKLDDETGDNKRGVAYMLVYFNEIKNNKTQLLNVFFVSFQV